MPDLFAGFQRREIRGVPVLWRADHRFKTFRVVFHSRRPLVSESAAAARSLLPSLLLQGTENDPDRPALARRMESLYGASVVPALHKHGECQIFRGHHEPIAIEVDRGAESTERDGDFIVEQPAERRNTCDELTRMDVCPVGAR